MRYACLVYIDDSAMAALSKEQGTRLADDSIVFDRQLKNRGHLILAQPLQSPETAVTIRVRNGKISEFREYADARPIVAAYAPQAVEAHA